MTARAGVAPRQASANWRLELLGGATLTTSEQMPLRLERKTAALLAYLALEGATPRSLIAGLLWPDSLETTARGNLRQLLRRLRDGAGADLIAGDDPLSLSGDVAVDAAQLELSAFAGDDAAVIAVDRELLEGLDFEDCADLTDWLLARRESLRELKTAALERLIVSTEASGDVHRALRFAENLLELNTVSEVAHRHVMRLRYLNGDRGSALRAYQRCCDVMQRELGVAPLPETTALASSISAGQQLESRVQMRPQLPLSVQRPPLLVGREAEWAALESAWETGLGIAVSGEAGVGKSRLTLEFIATKGAFALVQGRPGDDGVPYSTLARSLRQTLSDHPALELAPWVRLELSRLIPSLTTDTPPAISSDEGKLRFFESMAAALEPLIEAGLVALVMEDLQFADAASLEAGQYLATRFVAPSGASRLRSLSTYRSGELRGDTEALMQQGVSAGQVALIDLKPLAPPQLEALLTGLGVALPSGLPAALGRHSGGNPLFALETLRSLIESGDLNRDLLTERLPVPKRLEVLIAGRLGRLSQSAQRLARTAAVAGTDFSLELASAVLETHVLELSDALGELEAAQVMRGANFAHDLLAEATVSTVSTPIRTVLHRRIAGHLETVGAEPIRIARHWLEGEEDARAAPYLLEGARLAQNAFQHREATGLFEQAAAILEAHGEATRAFDALYEAAAQLQEFDPDERMMTVEHSLFRLVSGSSQESKALMVRAARLVAIGRADEAEPILKTALERATEAGDETMQGESVYGLGVTFWYAGRTQEALGFMRRALEIRERLGKLEDVLISQNSLAVVLGTLGRRSEATSLLRQVLTTELDTGVRGLESINTSIQIAVLDAERGQIKLAVPSLVHARTKLETLDDSHRITAVCLASLANCWGTLGEYHSAFEVYAQLFKTPPKVHSETYALAHVRLGMVYLELGQDARAEVELKTAETLLEGQAGFRESLKLAHARLCAWRGQSAIALFEEAERTLEPNGNGLDRCMLLITRAATRTPEESIRDAQRALELAQSEELNGLALGAHARLSQAYLRSGQASKALEHSLEATRGLDDLTCMLVSRAELLFTHFRALEANGKPEARAILEQAHSGLLGTADHHVPPEFRESFLTRNQVNRELIEATALLGLEPPT